jgi:hypothetical protein
MVGYHEFRSKFMHYLFGTDYDGWQLTTAKAREEGNEARTIDIAAVVFHMYE